MPSLINILICHSNKQQIFPFIPFDILLIINHPSEFKPIPFKPVYNKMQKQQTLKKYLSFLPSVTQEKFPQLLKLLADCGKEFAKQGEQNSFIKMVKAELEKNKRLRAKELIRFIYIFDSLIKDVKSFCQPVAQIIGQIYVELFSIFFESNFQAEIEDIKMVRKSWATLLPDAVLDDIQRKILRKHNYDLDKGFSKKKIDELRNYYTTKIKLKPEIFNKYLPSRENTKTNDTMVESSSDKSNEERANRIPRVVDLGNISTGLVGQQNMQIGQNPQLAMPYNPQYQPINPQYQPPNPQYQLPPNPYQNQYQNNFQSNPHYMHQMQMQYSQRPVSTHGPVPTFPGSMQPMQPDPKFYYSNPHNMNTNRPSNVNNVNYPPYYPTREPQYYPNNLHLPGSKQDPPSSYHQDYRYHQSKIQQEDLKKPKSNINLKYAQLLQFGHYKCPSCGLISNKQEYFDLHLKSHFQQSKKAYQSLKKQSPIKRTPALALNDWMPKDMDDDMLNCFVDMKQYPENVCRLCSGEFEPVWNADQEKWIFKDAVRVNSDQAQCSMHYVCFMALSTEEQKTEW